MRRKLFPMLLFAALTLLLGLAIACGDDDDDDDDGGDASPADGGGGEELTLEAYLTEVDEIQSGVTQAADSVGDQAQQAFSDPNMAFQAMSSAVDIGESAVTSLQALTPPAEAEEAHTNLISRGRGSRCSRTGCSRRRAGYGGRSGVRRVCGGSPGPRLGALRSDQRDGGRLRGSADPR